MRLQILRFSTCPYFVFLFSPFLCYFSIHFCFALRSFFNFSLSSSSLFPLSSCFLLPSSFPLLVPSSFLLLLLLLLLFFFFLFHILLYSFFSSHHFLCSSCHHYDRRCPSLFGPFWPSFSGSVQPVWPLRPLSGYSGRFGRISAISAAVRPLRFRALLRPLRLYFGHLLCRRLSRFGHRRLSGCLLPPVVPLRLSGPCLLFGHSPAADCSWPSVGPAIGFFWQPPFGCPHSSRCSATPTVGCLAIPVIPPLFGRHHFWAVIEIVFLAFQWLYRR